MTFSGPRGQRVPVSLYKITANYNVKPFVTSLVNPSGLALDREGNLFVSCRNDGTIHRITPDGRAEQWIEGMGVATGIAFDRAGNLYVGDRSGTIFKISPRARHFCVRDAGAFRCRVSPGVSSERRAVRHRPDDLQLTTACTASRRAVRYTCSSADLGARKAWLLTDANLYVAASLAAAAASCASRRRAHAERALSSGLGASSAWRCSLPRSAPSPGHHSQRATPSRCRLPGSLSRPAKPLARGELHYLT